MVREQRCCQRILNVPMNDLDCLKTIKREDIDLINHQSRGAHGGNNTTRVLLRPLPGAILA